MRKADIQGFRTSQKNDLSSDKFVGTLLLGQSNDFIKTWIIVLLYNADLT